TLVSLPDSRSLRDDEIAYLVTGSQGEMRAALWNLATGVYKGMQIESGDTVVLSARIIPGNEKNISRLIGHLYKRGANIIEEKRRLVHVSGHASQEDIKIMVETARPKFLIPIHGEYRMLFRHKEYVKNHVAGYTDANVVLIQNGDILELTPDSARIVDTLDLHKTFVDEESMTEIEYDIVRERKKLAYGGAISVVVPIDKRARRVHGEPQLTVRAVAAVEAAGALADEARRTITDGIDSLKIGQIAERKVRKGSVDLLMRRFVQSHISGKRV